MAKNILVVSDNHGNMSNLSFVLEEFKGKFDALVHCGDSEFSVDELRGMVGCPVYLAEGNCDYNFTADSEDIFEFEGHVCLVTHGHHRGVNWGDEELLDYALEMGADIVFYGHTHCPAYQVYAEEGVTMLNPGSIALPRQNPPCPTFLVLEFDDDGEFKPHFYSL